MLIFSASYRDVRPVTPLNAFGDIDVIALVSIALEVAMCQHKAN